MGPKWPATSPNWSPKMRCAKMASNLPDWEAVVVTERASCPPPRTTWLNSGEKAALLRGRSVLNTLSTSNVRASKTLAVKSDEAVMNSDWFLLNWMLFTLALCSRISRCRRRVSGWKMRTTPSSLATMMPALSGSHTAQEKRTPLTRPVSVVLTSGVDDPRVGSSLSNSYTEMLAGLAANGSVSATNRVSPWLKATDLTEPDCEYLAKQVPFSTSHSIADESAEPVSRYLESHVTSSVCTAPL
mmetsp:Transcript_13468/g.42985  ORF Transcript_13468/g.42985 Transcript_13468/m.42985 type:complete len:243 (+) Transcript_13468:242-970(+)